MRIIPLMYVSENHKLGRTLFDLNHRLLLREGTKISKSNKERLIDGGYYSIYIEDEYTDYKPEPLIPDMLRDKFLTTVMEAFRDFKILMLESKKAEYPGKSHRIKGLLNNRDKQMDKILNVSDEIIETLSPQRYSRIEFVEPKNMFNYAYQHALSTGIIASLIGFRMDQNINQIRSMFLASVLCEMGNLTIPDEILFKRGKLTVEEFEIIKQHCYNSYQQVNSCPDLNYMVKTICIEHHEKVDGSGYPNGLVEEEINTMTKIVAVADAYDALTSDRTYRMAYPPHKAIEHLKNLSGVHYNEDVVYVLSGIIQPFPIGTIVSLNTKQHGVVIESNETEPFRPKLKLLGQAIQEEVELTGHRGINITGIKYNP